MCKTEKPLNVSVPNKNVKNQIKTFNTEIAKSSFPTSKISSKSLQQQKIQETITSTHIYIHHYLPSEISFCSPTPHQRPSIPLHSLSLLQSEAKMRKKDRVKTIHPGVQGLLLPLLAGTRVILFQAKAPAIHFSISSSRINGQLKSKNHTSLNGTSP